MSNPNWQYDEMKHCGVDFSDPKLVEEYDNNHQKFRNYERDTEIVVKMLGLKPEYNVIDIGSGTGAFSLYAAKYCKLIHAVDVSEAMIEYTKQKADKMGIKNIVFHHGGFLTYKHQDDPVDAIVCSAALHHLPDFWKFFGLKRINEMLKPNGIFFLFDIVFPSDIADYETMFNNWIQFTASKVGDEFAKEAETHIRDEHSTYDWIMEGLLKRAGFQINNMQYTDQVNAIYICSKQGEK